MENFFFTCTSYLLVVVKKIIISHKKNARVTFIVVDWLMWTIFFSWNWNIKIFQQFHEKKLEYSWCCETIDGHILHWMYYYYFFKLFIFVWHIFFSNYFFIIIVLLVFWHLFCDLCIAHTHTLYLFIIYIGIIDVGTWFT